MFDFRINGPRYAIVGDPYVNYTVEVINLPGNMTRADVEIKWYKNGIEMPLFDWEDPLDIYLYDVGFPAAGTYYAVASVGQYVARSNEITLEIGTQYRQIKLTVNSRTRVEAEIGDIVTFAPVCSVTPSYVFRECMWVRNGVRLGEDEYISVPIQSESDYGTYMLMTRAYTQNGYTPAYQDNPLEIVPPGSFSGECPLIYTHDLNDYELGHGGGRDRGYIWVGWWVMDEIVEAMIEGFKWFEDPHNSRFKYPCEIAAIAAGFNRWPDMEIQESRHGYILNKRDLWVY